MFLPLVVYSLSLHHFLFVGAVQRNNLALLQKTGDDAVSEIMIVNGVESPLVTVQAEVWERWRIVFSSMESFYTFSFDNPVCSMQLLAKVKPLVAGQHTLFKKLKCAVSCSSLAFFPTGWSVP